MLQVTENELKKRLAFDNPWWAEGAVFARVRAMPRRAYFDGFMRLVEETSVTRALVLMGPRRVGKTIMLTQAVQKLIDDGIAPNRIFYAALDTPTYSGLTLEKLLTLFLESHGHGRGQSLYVFYDEIQYHPDWEGHLKPLGDSHPGFRFVVSGAAAAAPRTSGRESDAGRFTNFPLPPLDFAEFLRFRKLEDSLIDRRNLKIRDIDALNAAFVDYLNFGGFPEVVLDPAVRVGMDRFVANDMVDKVLLRDLPGVYGITDTQELKRLFTTLAYNTGNEVTYQALSQAIGIAKNTLRRYLDYLEAAFLIHRHHRVDQDAKRFERATRFKVYLTNPCIRAALFGPVGPQDEAMGRLAETSLVSQLAQSAVAARCFYANWKTGAVDLVLLHAVTEKPMVAWEIEWGDGAAHRPRETLRSLIEFCDKHGLQEASVSVKSISKEEVVDGIKIRYIPNSFASYILPVFTMESVLRAGLRRTTEENSA